MNQFEKALENIAQQYAIRRFNQNYAQIEFDILFDDYNYIFIGVLFEDDKVILTDFADYAPLCDWDDVDIPDIVKICRKHNITFFNYHIECLYQTNDDVKRYLECLLELKDKYIKE